MAPKPYDKPLPVIDPDSEGFWEHAKQHRLSVQHCLDCGHLHFPPSPVCPACLSGDQEWSPVSGRGTLVSWVKFHRAYWDGYRHKLPYDACLVELEEGPLVVSNFVDGVPTDARMGMKLRVAFDDVTEEVSLPRFEPE